MKNYENYHFEDLTFEATWIRDLAKQRIEELSNPGSQTGEVCGSPPPDLTGSHYADYLAQNDLKVGERLLLAVSFFKTFDPTIFAAFLRCIEPGTNSIRLEIGGFVMKGTVRFIPTLQTAIFLLAGENSRIKWVL